LGFAHASSTPEFFEVVEFGIPVNDGTVVVMRAIVIDDLVDPLEDKYRHNLQELIKLFSSVFFLSFGMSHLAYG
jgi:hypothetical protein